MVAAVGATVAVILLGTGAASATRAPGRVVLAFPDAPAVRSGPRVFSGASAAAALRDGRIVIAGQRADGSLVVAQLTADGDLDDPFGVSGFAWPSLPMRVRPMQILVQPDGRVLVVGAAAAPARALPDMVLVRLTPGGKGDVSFGQGGVSVLRGLKAACVVCQPAALAPDGGIVLAADTQQRQVVVVRVTPSGALDAAFGQGGIAAVGGGDAQAVAVRADGSVAVAAEPALLAQLTPAGALDPAFAGGAPVATPFAPRRLLAQPDGTLLVLGPPGVARYAPDGALRGMTALSVPAPAALLPSPAGGALVVGGPGPGAVVVARVAADGSPDAALGGAGGARIELPFGGADLRRGGTPPLTQDTFEPAAIAQRRDGSLVVAGEVHVSAARFISRPAVAVLTTGLGLDPAFGGAAPLRLAVRLPAQRVSDSVGLRIDTSQPGVAAVVVRAHGATVARATVPLFIAGAQRAAVPLTATGKRLLARHRRLRIHVAIAARDLAANPAAASARGAVVSALRGSRTPARSRAGSGRSR